MNKILAKVSKNSLTELIFSLSNFKGKDYVDIRTFIKAEDGTSIPTKKGISVPVNMYREFRKAFFEAEIELINSGAIDKEDLMDD